MCFANNAIQGLNLAVPDVCYVPAIVPIPTPLINIANRAMSNPATTNMKVLYSGGAAAHVNTLIFLSSGNEAGVGGGVASGMFIGPCRSTTGSNCVFHQGMPATTLISLTLHNGMAPNTAGTGVMPSQTKVMIMR